MGYALPFLSSAAVTHAAPTYNDDILPIFKDNCTGCHNPDKLKADLDLTTYAIAMKGGSSGAAVKAGSPDTSLHLPRHDASRGAGDAAEETETRGRAAQSHQGMDRRRRAGIQRRRRRPSPAMPPWQMVASRRGRERPTARRPCRRIFRPPPIRKSSPDPRRSSRSPPVRALRSPPSSSHAQVLLYNTETKALLGALPFPERQPNVLRFSRDGSLLLAAGGRGAHSGKAVVFDIKTGQRVAEAGTEASDAILAADLSPDRSLIATGGGDKLVRLYSTKDGKLQRTIKKHTDWVTALAFSPDGEKLATADRNGGLHLWDPKTGTILYTLAEHQARITSLAWRGDSLILASAGDDGKLILWDTAEGWAAKSMTPANGSPKDKPGRKTMLLKVPGVLSADFAPDGRLAITCRDNAVRVYNTNSNPVAVIKDLPDIPTAAVFTKPGGQLLTGDFRGVLQLWDFQEKQKTAVPAGELGK